MRGHGTRNDNVARRLSGAGDLSGGSGSMTGSPDRINLFRDSSSRFCKPEGMRSPFLLEKETSISPSGQIAAKIIHETLPILKCKGKATRHSRRPATHELVSDL